MKPERTEALPKTAVLPQLLADYFAATNAHDVAAMSALFSEDATVHDEGRDHRGLPAIRAWMTETIAAYRFQVAPLEWSSTGDRMVVLVSLRGTFPGSPITLPFRFTLDGHKVSRLEIG